MHALLVHTLFRLVRYTFMSRSTALVELPLSTDLNKELEDSHSEGADICRASAFSNEVDRPTKEAPSNYTHRRHVSRRSGKRSTPPAADLTHARNPNRWRRLPPLEPGTRACIVCGSIHTGTYGAGRYCSRSCSHRASAWVKWGRISRDDLLHTTEVLGPRWTDSTSAGIGPAPTSSRQPRRGRRHRCNTREAKARDPMDVASTAVMPSPATARVALASSDPHPPLIACRLRMWVESLQSWKAVCIRAYDIERDLHLVCLRGSSDSDGHGACCHWVSLRRTRVQFPPLEPPSPDMIERLLRESPEPAL
jgi:hypothetical protein